MRILLTGGGTGGHVFPLVAVARELKRTAKEKGILTLEFFYVGPDDFGREIFEKEGIDVRPIFAAKLRRYASAKTVVDIFIKAPVGFMQALWLVWNIMPDVIFSKGGYGGVSVVLAGWCYLIPILIHESDSIPGLANRRLAKFAKRVAVSFPSSAAEFPAKKTAVTGNPVRKEILEGDGETAARLFSITPQKPTVLIMAGSQGAQTINDIIVTVLPRLLTRVQIIHQTGPNNYEQVKAEAHVVMKDMLPEFKSNYHPFPFLDEEHYTHALKAASLIIARSGSSIFEIAAAEKPSILIPLSSSAANHQKRNAYEYAATGAAVVIEETNLIPNLFVENIVRLLDDPDALEEMGKKGKSFYKPDAGRKIAEELIRLAE